MELNTKKPTITIALVVSTQDPASCVMKDEFLSLDASNPWQFVQTNRSFEGMPLYHTTLNNETENECEIFLYTTNENPIHFETMDSVIDADHIIVLSKHTAQSKKPAFCVHSCGNFASAQLGGREKTLSTSAPLFQTIYFRTLAEYIDHFNSSSPVKYEAVMEATHHGPAVVTPLTFVEIGSSQEEWTIPENAQFVRSVLYQALIRYCSALKNTEDTSIAVAIGGPHYTPHISRYLLTKALDCSVGHILPKYHLSALDLDTVLQMIERTPGCTQVLIDWKGLSGYKETAREVWAALEKAVPAIEVIRI